MATELQRTRYLEVHVNDFIVRAQGGPSLRVIVKISKSLTKEPNSASITFFNLAHERRAALTSKQAAAVSVIAGYDRDRTTLFYGSTAFVRNERSGADILTTLTTTDGGDKTRKARATLTFGPRAKAGDVLRALVKHLGVKVGNLESVAAALNAGKGASMFAGGVVLSGNAAHAVDNLCRSAGLEWSIQDGAIQLLNAGAASSKTAIKLTPGRLLVSPSIDEKGVVSAQARLQADFLPGRQVQIAHEFVNGAFRLEKCVYSLDTHGEEWTVDFEAKVPK